MIETLWFPPSKTDAGTDHRLVVGPQSALMECPADFAPHNVSSADNPIAPANDEEPAYTVRIAPLPCVIDADGQPVADTQVLEIQFPGESIETPAGWHNVIIGPGVAKIMVGDATIRGVPLC